VYKASGICQDAKAELDRTTKDASSEMDLFSTTLRELAEAPASEFDKVGSAASDAADAEAAVSRAYTVLSDRADPEAAAIFDAAAEALSVAAERLGAFSSAAYEYADAETNATTNELNETAADALDAPKAAARAIDKASALIANRRVQECR